MGTKKHYKTLQGLVKQSFNDITFDNIKTGRFYHKNLGWVRFTLPDDVEEKIFQQIADEIGGRKPSKVLNGLKYTSYNWSYGRFIYSKHTNSFKYCAGQDYPSELRQIRKDLYN